MFLLGVGFPKEHACVQRLHYYVLDNHISKADSSTIIHIMFSIEKEIRNRCIGEQVGIIDEPPNETHLVLIPEDYPLLYRSSTKLFAHPEDYKVTEDFVPPSMFVFKHETRTRLFVRLSFRLDSDGGLEYKSRFVSATFVMDTGCSPHFIISDELWGILSSHKRIHESELGPSYIDTKVGGKHAKCRVSNDVPSQHKPANFLGLPMFFLLGVKFPAIKIGELDYEKSDCSQGAIQHTPFDVL